MRKASQDGGDNTSITSGIECETKKPGASILKSTRNSIKRKVQSFSIESDDMASEPLLHKNKEKTEIEKQSAKFIISKTKTDFVSERGDDRDKLLADDKIEKPSISDVTGITRGATIGNDLKEQTIINSQTSAIYNHMNTNVFNDPERPSNSITPKAQVLVELDISKPSGPKYTPSSSIFTTAKIHTDGKKQHMEPVQVTPVPILSTIEGGAVKTETKLKENDKTPGEKIIKNSNKMDITTNGIALQIKEKEVITVSSPLPQGSNLPKLGEKGDVVKCEKINSKNLKESPETKSVIESKLTGSTLETNNIPRVSKSVPISPGMDETKQGPTYQGPSFDKNYVDINKNIQSPSSSKPFKNISNNKEKYSEASQSFVLSTTDNRDNNTRSDTVKTHVREQLLSTSHGIRNEKSAKDITSSNLSEKFPATSVSDTYKSGPIDKVPSAKSPKVAQTTSAIITPLSNVSNVITVSTLPKIENSTSIVTSTTSISPCSAVTVSTTTKTKGFVDNTSTPTYSDIKKSVDQNKWLENDLKSASNIQASVKNTGGNVSKSPHSGQLDSKSSSIGTPKNTATVVSSITKPTSTASITKTPDASSSTGKIKVSSSTKQSATTSTVRTIFSANQTVKSPIVKSNLRIASNEVDKSKTTVKRNTSQSSGATEGSAVGAKILGNTKPTVTSSLMKAQKNTNDKSSKISEYVKDSKGSDADK